MSGAGSSAVPSECGIRFVPYDLENEYMHVGVLASNASFCGRAEIHWDWHSLRDLVSRLQLFATAGFDDRHAFEWGNVDDRSEDDGVHLTFSSRDEQGHVAVEVRIRRRSWDGRTNSRETAHFRLSTEPVLLDTFLDALRRWAPGWRGAATLEGRA